MENNFKKNGVQIGSDLFGGEHGFQQLTQQIRRIYGGEVFGTSESDDDHRKLFRTLRREAMASQTC